ncbi:MAG: TatD family hydrolase [Alphaproteobacteria bacterium]|nr:TatD family hydrolase [Alphaproteobacteria bacterium]
MGWFDSHCHLDFPAFDADRDAVVDRARSAGVEAILVPGVASPAWGRVLACRARYPDLVHVALGLHPAFLDQVPVADLDAALAELGPRLQGAGAVALGECGLDKLCAVPLDLQIRVFRTQLELAARLDLPVLLHCVRAHGLMLELLAPFAPLQGVLHSYSGSAELVPRYAAMGLMFSFSGSVTRPRARRIRAAARAVPAERLLVETDAPDQPPEGAPSRRNEPAHGRLVIEALEALRGAAVPDNRGALLGG